jgi:hypothetical protein
MAAAMNKLQGNTTMRRAFLMLALWLFMAGPVTAQSQTPFDRLAGQWSGSGTIELAEGRREPIKCRASYDVLSERSNLQLNIRCASDSFNFELRGSATYSGGSISGSWSEATRNASGTISGKASGDRFQVLAKGPAFTADLSLVTQGNRQSVVIKSQEKDTAVRAVTITLQRG